MCDVAVPGDGFTSQVVQEQWLNGIGKVDSISGISYYLQEDCDKLGKGGVGDSASLAHLVGTLNPGEPAVVAIYPSCSDTEKEPSSITAANSSSKRVVSFGLIQVREYDCVVGDNPTVRAGPPMSIGWEFVQKRDVPLDDYEKVKRPRTSDFRMASFTRKRLLRHEFDVSLEDIRAAENIARKIQIQRCQTMQQGKTGAAIECAMESFKRKMHRTFFNKLRLCRYLAHSAKGNRFDP
jgi:hypothetical protein